MNAVRHERVARLADGVPLDAFRSPKVQRMYGHPDVHTEYVYRSATLGAHPRRGHLQHGSLRGLQDRQSSINRASEFQSCVSGYDGCQAASR